jgi:hypothetical protein
MDLLSRVLAFGTENQDQTPPMPEYSAFSVYGPGLPYWNNDITYSARLGKLFIAKEFGVFITNSIFEPSTVYVELDPVELISRVIETGSMLIAGSASGNIYTSVDGLTWQKHITGVTFSIQDIAYNNGVCVVVGTDLVILKSTDFVTWDFL